jgi:hypothetical protein
MLKVLRITGDSVTLQWSAPYSDGGSEITRYVVLQRQAPAAGKMSVTTTLDEWDEVGKVSGSTTSYTVSRLREGRSYHFAVYAVNRAGKGDVIETARAITPRKAFGKTTVIHGQFGIQRVI